MTPIDFEAEILVYDTGYLGAISGKFWRWYRMILRNGA